MISSYIMAVRIGYGVEYLPEAVKDLLTSGQIREAIVLLRQDGYAHLEDMDEAERGFNDVGYCSAPHRAIAS